MPYCLITHFTVSITRFSVGLTSGPVIFVDAPPPVSLVGLAIEVERKEVWRRMVDVVVADLGRAGQARVNVMPGGMQDDIKRGVGTGLLRMEHQEGVGFGRRIAPFLLDAVLEGLQFPLREYRFLFLSPGAIRRFGTGRDRKRHDQTHREHRLFHVIFLARCL